MKGDLRPKPYRKPLSLQHSNVSHSPLSQPPHCAPLQTRGRVLSIPQKKKKLVYDHRSNTDWVWYYRQHVINLMNENMVIGAWMESRTEGKTDSCQPRNDMPAWNTVSVIHPCEFTAALSVDRQDASERSEARGQCAFCRPSLHQTEQLLTAVSGCVCLEHKIWTEPLASNECSIVFSKKNLRSWPKLYSHLITIPFKVELSKSLSISVISYLMKRHTVWNHLQSQIQSQSPYLFYVGLIPGPCTLACCPSPDCSLQRLLWQPLSGLHKHSYLAVLVRHSPSATEHLTQKTSMALTPCL